MFSMHEGNRNRNLQISRHVQYPISDSGHIAKNRITPFARDGGTWNATSRSWGPEE